MGSMSGDVVIRSRGLGKRYRIGHAESAYRTLRESVAGMALAPARKLAALARGEPLRRRLETMWALRDIDLDVRRGEVLGIIGRNGAGKSTLLKILSRITEPTAGRVELRGRVGSLLEVGTGFHPELTGRENIYLNGAILGMRRAEIRSRFDEIVEFAEVGRFLDTPVKRYSSGMYVRLAFAVAAHMEPEILLVDEVLAVGDVAFQKKCLGKIGDVAREGRTVLFVSHQLAAVATLSSEVLVLKDGYTSFKGSTPLAVESYLSSLQAASGQPSELRSNDGSLFVRSFQVTDEAGRETDTVANDAEVCVRVQLKLLKRMPGLAIGFTLSLPTGDVVFSSFHTDLGAGEPFDCVEPGEYLLSASIPPLLLNEKTYLVGPIIQVPGSKMLVDLPRLKRVHVVRTTSKAGGAPRPGSVLPYLGWTIANVSAHRCASNTVGSGCQE